MCLHIKYRYFFNESNIASKKGLVKVKTKAVLFTTSAVVEKMARNFKSFTGDKLLKLFFLKEFNPLRSGMTR